MIQPANQPAQPSALQPGTQPGRRAGHGSRSKALHRAATQALHPVDVRTSHESGHHPANQTGQWPGMVAIRRRRSGRSTLSTLAVAGVALLGATGCVVESASNAAPVSVPSTSTTTPEQMGDTCVLVDRLATTRTSNGDVLAVLTEMAAVAPPDAVELITVLLEPSEPTASSSSDPTATEPTPMDPDDPDAAPIDAADPHDPNNPDAALSEANDPANPADSSHTSATDGEADARDDAWNALEAWALQRCAIDLVPVAARTDSQPAGIPPDAMTERVRFVDVLAAVEAKASPDDAPWWEEATYVGSVAGGADSLTVGVRGVPDVDTALTVCRDIVEVLTGVRPSIIVWVRDPAGDLLAIAPVDGCRASASVS